MPREKYAKALNETVSQVWEEIFNEKSEINEEHRVKKVTRSTLSVVIQQNQSSQTWEVKFNDHNIGSYKTLKEAEHTADILLLSYNYGLLEGLEKGALLGTEGYPDALTIQLNIQEVKDFD